MEGGDKNPDPSLTWDRLWGSTVQVTIENSTGLNCQIDIYYTRVSKGKSSQPYNHYHHKSATNIPNINHARSRTPFRPNHPPAGGLRTPPTISSSNKIHHINPLTPCQDQKAALALVNTRPEGTTPTSSSSSTDSSDPDLKRAKDLLELHADVKLAHADGTDPELIEARRAVGKVLREL